MLTEKDIKTLEEIEDRCDVSIQVVSNEELESMHEEFLAYLDEDAACFCDCDCEDGVDTFAMIDSDEGREIYINGERLMSACHTEIVTDDELDTMVMVVFRPGNIELEIG